MHRKMKYFKIIDILHTGHHGPAGVSKEGEKYAARRNRVFSLDMTTLEEGNTLTFFPVIKWTTPFEKYWVDELNYHHILTLNSEYILEEIKGGL